MKSPLPAAEAAAEAYATAEKLPTKREWIETGGGEHSQYLSYEVRYFVEDAFLAGHAWTLQHLSEQGAGEINPDRISDGDEAWRACAAQSAAVIAGLRFELSQADAYSNQHREYMRKQDDEIAALKASEARADAAHGDALIEIERLRDKCERHVEYAAALRAELADMETDVEFWKTKTKDLLAGK